MISKKVRETQSQSLKSQLDKSSPEPSGVGGQASAKAQILTSLTDQKFHGKKTDIPVELITFGTNQRSEIGDVSSLKAQIREAGLLQPIGIQLLDNEITCVYGNRRLQAFKELAQEDSAKFGTISCIIQVYQDAEQGRIVAQAIENLGREDLAPLDECIAISETKAALSSKSGSPISNEQLGDFLGGRHRKTIDLAVTIANWPQSAHEIIKADSNKFSITILRNIAKKNLTEEALLQALRKVSSEQEAEPTPIKNDVFYERPRRDQLQKFEGFLKTSQAPDEMCDFLRKQNKWLWSKEARKAVRKVLSEYFED
ncbi:MAG: ParB N-terminal domain-containing protein [Pseudobdellovibrionaceae bacterium]|nr:ParB N-terminal domain-containing protein [Pseudobdellovibrionaceae bacterium]